MPLGNSGKPDVASRIRIGIMAALALMTTTPAHADSGYTFGVVPQFEPRRLSEIWTPILEEVSSRSGIELHMVGSPRIPEFEQSFQQGEFDFAYMNPYHSLRAFETQGYMPLVRDGGRKLFGILVVHKDAPYTSVEELEGATIAFPAPNALGASLLMRAQLDRQFGLDFTPSYVSTHSSAYLNVALGETKAAGGVMGTFNRLDEDIRNQLKILFETDRVAPHPIMAHPMVSEADMEAIRQAFLDLAATPEGQEMLAKVPIRQAVVADREDYSELYEFNLDDYYVDPTSN